MIKETFEISKIVKPRGLYQIMTSLAQEVGEVAEEVEIAAGDSYKEPKEGILGEAVDVIICALDLIWVDNPRVTEEEIMGTLRWKLDKWKDKKGG